RALSEGVTPSSESMKPSESPKSGIASVFRRSRPCSRQFLNAGTMTSNVPVSEREVLPAGSGPKMALVSAPPQPPPPSPQSPSSPRPRPSLIQSSSLPPQSMAVSTRPHSRIASTRSSQPRSSQGLIWLFQRRVPQESPPPSGLLEVLMIPVPPSFQSQSGTSSHFMTVPMGSSKKSMTALTCSHSLMSSTSLSQDSFSQGFRCLFQILVPNSLQE